MTTTALRAINSYLDNVKKHRYSVSVMGPDLTYIHTEEVVATTPGDAIDIVAGKLDDKRLTQYACILLDVKPIKLEAV